MSRAWTRTCDNDVRNSMIILESCHILSCKISSMNYKKIPNIQLNVHVIRTATRKYSVHRYISSALYCWHMLLWCNGVGHVRYLSISGPRGSAFRYISISVPEWSRCHFRDHHQITFGTSMDHFGTKFLLTFGNVDRRTCSRPERGPIAVCFDVCSVNDRSYKLDQRAV